MKSPDEDSDKSYPLSMAGSTIKSATQSLLDLHKTKTKRLCIATSEHFPSNRLEISPE